jgi:gas vesicle protein
MIAAIFEILGGIGGAIAALSSALLAIVTGLLVRERGKRKKAEDYIDTRKEIDDAMGGIPRDPTAAREWLRERQRTRNL